MPLPPAGRTGRHTPTVKDDEASGERRSQYGATGQAGMHAPPLLRSQVKRSGKDQSAVPASAAGHRVRWRWPWGATRRAVDRRRPASRAVVHIQEGCTSNWNIGGFQGTYDAGGALADSGHPRRFSLSCRL